MYPSLSCQIKQYPATIFSWLVYIEHRALIGLLSALGALFAGSNPIAQITNSSKSQPIHNQYKELFNKNSRKDKVVVKN